jgi:hypothetical protein
MEDQDKALLKKTIRFIIETGYEETRNEFLTTNVLADEIDFIDYISDNQKIVINQLKEKINFLNDYNYEIDIKDIHAIWDRDHFWFYNEYQKFLKEKRKELETNLDDTRDRVAFVAVITEKSKELEAINEKGVKVDETRDQIIFSDAIVKKLHDTFNNVLWVDMKYSDFYNCFDRNNAPIIYPDFTTKRGGAKFIFILSHITPSNGIPVNDNIALKCFGLKLYSQRKHSLTNLKENGPFLRKLKDIFKDSYTSVSMTKHNTIHINK